MVARPLRRVSAAVVLSTVLSMLIRMGSVVSMDVTLFVSAMSTTVMRCAVLCAQVPRLVSRTYDSDEATPWSGGVKISS